MGRVVEIRLCSPTEHDLTLLAPELEQTTLVVFVFNTNSVLFLREKENKTHNNKK